MEELLLENRKCKICGDAGTVVFLGVSSYDEGLPEKVYSLTKELLCAASGKPGAATQNAAPFILFAFEARDWNSEFSPWAAETDKPFPGEGPKTLAWLTDFAIPTCKECFGTEKFAIAGYSLAGLFALWAALEAPEFSAAACVSGSLWFPGWKDYAKDKCPAEGLRVYLSVGGKEANSPNPWMRTIDDAYRAQDQLLKAQKIAHIYEKNPGGHFASPEKRLAKGIAWMLK